MTWLACYVIAAFIFLLVGFGYALLDRAIDLLTSFDVLRLLIPDVRAWIVVCISLYFVAGSIFTIAVALHRYVIR